MSHVILHCAEFESEAAARRAAADLTEFCGAYAIYERATYQQGTVAAKPSPPLIEFAAKHGVALRGTCEILIKGLSEDELHVVRVDRLVCFYAGGFELGGDAIEAYFAVAGASHYSRDTARLCVESRAPAASARELAEFLDDEDYDEQYTLLEDGTDQPESSPFSVRFEQGATSCMLCFDDSGVQDWAFIRCLRQLDGQAPRLQAPAPRQDAPGH